MTMSKKQAFIINDRADGVSRRATLHYFKMEASFIEKEQVRLSKMNMPKIDIKTLAKENVIIRHHQRMDKISDARRNMLEQLRSQTLEHELARQEIAKASKTKLQEKTKPAKAERSWFAKVFRKKPEKLKVEPTQDRSKAQNTHYIPVGVTTHKALDLKINVAPAFQSSAKIDKQQRIEQLDKGRATPSSSLEMRPDGMTVKTSHEHVERKREKEIKRLQRTSERQDKSLNPKRDFDIVRGR